MPADQVARAQLTPRQAGILAGGPLAAQVFRTVIGPAVSVFGRYSRVYNLDGSQVTVGELLDLVQAPTPER